MNDKIQRDRLSSREIKRDLKSIYCNADGSMPNISRLDHRKRGRIFRFLLSVGLILLILVGVSWLGFIAFQKYAPQTVNRLTSEGEMVFKIEAPEQADSGDEVVYKIKYENHKKVAVNNAEINVRYPSGLKIESSDPAPEVRDSGQEPTAAEDNWQFGTIARGETGEIDIKGKLIAEKGSNQNIWAVIYYTPSNFSSQFQEEASATTKINAAPVAVVIDGPDSADTKDKITLAIKYKNTSDQDIANFKIEVDYPTGFAVDSTDPEIEDNKNYWTDDVLKPNDKKEIKISGMFAATVSGDQEFSIKTSIKDDKTGDYSVMETIPYDIVVAKGDLAIELNVSGVKDVLAANLGDELKYSLTYSNSGKKDMENLTASVFFTNVNNLIDWSTLTDRYGGTLDDFEAGKVLTWTGNEVPNLLKLSPGDKGVIDFSVKIKASTAAVAGFENIALFKIGKVGGKEVNIENKSNKIMINFNSDLKATVYGRYFDDSASAIGSGPIPPKQGEETTYVIFWRLDNSLHEVDDVSLTTVLPANVTWVGQRSISAGDIQYNSSTRQVTWTINRIPTDMAIAKQVSFAVSITPTASDVGKVLALTGDNNLVAKDKVTGADLSQAVSAITTNIVTDPVVKGKGVVVK